MEQKGDLNVGHTLTTIGSVDKVNAPINNVPAPTTSTHPIPLSFLDILLGENSAGDALQCQITGEQHYKGKRVLELSRIADNDTDIQAEKEQIVGGFNFIMPQWKSFSHMGNMGFPAVPADVTPWEYYFSSGGIMLNRLTQSFVGTVCPEKVTDYTLDYRILCSDFGTDFALGMVLAYTEIDGKQYTLNALRSLGGEGYTWAVGYNTRQDTQQLIINESIKVYWGNGLYGATAAEANYRSSSWDRFRAGVRISATRTGDVFTLQTSQLNTPLVVDDTTTITFDLNDYPELHKFKNECSVGFCTFRQMCGVLPLRVDIAPCYIVDQRDNTILEWQTDKWVTSSTTLPQIMTVGTLQSNQRNYKMFYLQYNDKILKIA